MRILQAIITALLPRSIVEQMREETDQWQIRCTSCGRTKPLWEAGGIRYKKRPIGSVSGTLVRCSQCNGLRCAIVERSQDSEDAKPAVARDG